MVGLGICGGGGRRVGVAPILCVSQPRASLSKESVNQYHQINYPCRIWLDPWLIFSSLIPYLNDSVPNIPAPYFWFDSYDFRILSVSNFTFINSVYWNTFGINLYNFFNDLIMSVVTLYTVLVGSTNLTLNKHGELLYTTIIGRG